MERDIRKHIGEERLEAYAMRSLAADEIADVEEHLLFCATCQDQVEAAERYVKAMKGAAVRIREVDQPATVKPGTFDWLRAWFRTPAPIWAGALAMAALILAVGLHWKETPGTPVEVELQAVRGSSAGTAPSGHALDLKLDSRGMPEMPSWRVAIVDEEGRKIWTGVGIRSDQFVIATADQSFKPGTYFVRLLKDGEDPVREYQLIVNK